MQKGGMLNSSIAKVLADLGHTDTIVIGDCGLPVPAGVPKIDLALKPGMPSFVDVVTEVAKNMVIEKCYEAGVPVMLNPAPVAPVPPELLAKVTYLTPNEHEAAILFAGQGKADILGRNQGKVIMTLGSKGVAYAEKGQVYNVPGFKVQPVDTTGAGDTFNGAFAVARANGKNMYDSISFANAAAALSVQKLGAQGGMPYLNEVEEMLK